MKRVYLDYSAATPIENSVLLEMHRQEKKFSNPSSVYKSGRDSKEIINSTLKRIGMFFGAKSEELTMTSGSTESNNIAILGVVRSFSEGEIISIRSEHSSVREPIKQLESEGYKVRWCSLDKNGKIIIPELKNLLTKKTRLVSISYANGEIGSIQQISKISNLIREFEIQNNVKIAFHTDASAALGTLNCDVNRLGVDLLTCSSSKIYGPKGIGLLYIKRNTPIAKIMFGGLQQSSVRPGTEDLVSIVGFAKALDVLNDAREDDIRKYKQYYVDCICNINAVKFIENGHSKDRIFSVLNLSFDGINGENLVAYMDAEGFEIATGAACEASNDKPSEALLAIGRTYNEAKGSIRVSFGRKTTQSEINHFIKTINKVLLELR